MGLFYISSPKAPSSVSAVVIWASISTWGSIGHADTLPVTTQFLHHQRRHSQASIICGPRAFLCGVKVRLAALKTRSYGVAMAGQDK